MRKEVWILLILAVLIALFLSPFASPFPDGLERVAEDKGFLEKSEGKEIINSPIPDYIFPGITNEKVATAVAGIVGTLLTLTVAYGIAVLIKGRAASKQEIQERHEQVSS
ncbi:MAG: PDGLE domain-containing protein [Bacillota bacterium]|nr:PDGLE domain-containing protein [Bacillota bacterium]